MLAGECPDCKTGRKLKTILTGSTRTLTDAQLVRAHCVKTGMKRILVFPDPDHMRRASILFRWEFAGTGFEVITVSSGDDRDLPPPADPWWLDDGTTNVIMSEAAKIGAFLLRPLSGSPGHVSLAASDYTVKLVGGR
jgi:hypothetical protein